MKLLVMDTPLKVVVNSPTELAGNAVTVAGILLDWVPIPRTRLPLTEGAPPRGTPGSCTSIPLLSWGRRATGFCTWLASGTVVPLQAPPLQAEYILLFALDVHSPPQSCLKRPTPRIPLNPAVAGLASAFRQALE